MVDIDSMTRREKLYEGKAKILYRGEEEHTIIQHFKDDATADNAAKKGSFAEKGHLNNLISAYFMEKLKDYGVPNHFIKRTSRVEQVVKEVEIIPIEVVVRNYAAGSILTRLGLEKGDNIQGLPDGASALSSKPSAEKPLIEFFFKDDDLNDPLISEGHILHFGWATAEELEIIKDFAAKINVFLTEEFASIGIKFVDAKFEFGKNHRGRILLADEICPDTCRLWDIKTGDSLDKDLFRKGLGGETDAYTEVAERLGLIEKERDEEHKANLKKVKK